jgi:hypothetical protein
MKLANPVQYQANMPPMTKAAIPDMCHSKYMLAHRNETKIDTCRIFHIMRYATINAAIGDSH